MKRTPPVDWNQLPSGQRQRLIVLLAELVQRRLDPPPPGEEEAGPNAKAIRWRRITPVDDTLPGVYCLRTNQREWDEATLWHTYVTLTDLEIHR